ncbi:MAG TPA: DNA recombination protein RmuC [Acidobacteriaceae bacterium]
MFPWIAFAAVAVAATAGWVMAVRARTRTTEVKTLLEAAQQEIIQQRAALERSTREKEQAEREKALTQGTLEAQKSALETAERAMGNTFGALAAKALQDNNASFLTLAQQELGKQQADATNKLDAKEKAIETLLQPVGEALEKLQTTTQELEVKREGAYQAVLGVVQGVAEVSDRLGAGTRQLIEALRKPQVRGNWGQEQLERCVEFAGMVEHVSFDKEVSVRDGDSIWRPDCVVQLPNGRSIIVDVKTPLEALLNASGTTDESERAAFLLAHARNVRKHLDNLSSKSYWKQFSDSPEFVVCFLPSEAAFSAALDQDRTLIEYGSRANVILATPTTLIALLKAVAYGWQQMQITRNAVAIREAAQSLYEKLATAQEYFTKMGSALGNAVKHYNSLIGCVEGPRSVFSQARKLRELGIGQENLAEMPILESAVRDLKSDDWQSDARGNIAEAAAVADELPFVDSQP